MKLSTVRNIWLASLLLVAAGYTVLAFGLDWRTEAGRIGPGFFPRVIGVALVGALLVALARSLWQQRSDDGQNQGGHARTLVLILGATVLFLALFRPLGALLSGAGYMFALLLALNPRRWVVNVSLAIGLPTALYLLFHTWLDATLPAGPLAVF